MESVLRIEKLKYKEILKDITFSLENKSFNILVGSNGSGKTTLVNCIRGLLKYTGDIYISNNKLNQCKIFNMCRDIGFFVNDGIILEETIYNELLMLLKNLDYEEEVSRKKIYNIAKKLNFTELLFKKQEELTNSEMTLVLFAFSIIYEPKVVVIDNELGNLDELNKKRILDYLKNQKKITVLFITTNSEYFYLADKLLFLKDGTIIAEDCLEEMIKNEKLFIKSGTTLPFCIDLSNKLISYDLLVSIESNMEKLVNEIWK